MTFVDGKILIIDNVDVIGKFYLHHSTIKDSLRKNCLQACLKVSTKNDCIEFVGGYLDVSQNFHPCPISAKYVQITSLSAIDGASYYASSQLTVFSKTFTKSRRLNIRIFPMYSENIMAINRYVNLLNSYVDLENDIDEIDEEYFQARIKQSDFDSENIIREINELKITYYENSQSRVGKDNRFWNEIVIANLPQSRYRLNTICTALERLKSFDSISILGDKVVLTYNSSYAYSSHHGLIKVEHSLTEELKLKDLIKYNYLTFYDIVKDKAESLKIKI